MAVSDTSIKIQIKNNVNQISSGIKVVTVGSLLSWSLNRY